MDNLWHPPLSVRAAISRGNNKLRAARKRQDLQRKAERKTKRNSLPILDDILASFGSK